jgi:uncharacterized protein (TIGR02996 family)
MSDEPALLAAIRAHPDEDTPRLMYADWLDEHGQPDRAEFIRLQCAVAVHEAPTLRALELQERNREQWLAGVPQFAGERWGFWRGFPEELRVPGDLFLERYEEFARVPWLRFLWLRELSPRDVRDLANQTWPPQWVELTLSAGWADTRAPLSSAFVALAGCSRLSQLRLLRLLPKDLDADSVDAFVASPHLAQLQQFRLHGDPDSGWLSLIGEPLRERFGDRLVVGWD